MRFLAGALIAVLSAVQGGPASGIEGERAFFPARQEERARLVINGATDLTAMQPLILDFQEMSPDVAVESSTTSRTNSSRMPGRPAGKIAPMATSCCRPRSISS